MERVLCNSCIIKMMVYRIYVACFNEDWRMESGPSFESFTETVVVEKKFTFNYIFKASWSVILQNTRWLMENELFKKVLRQTVVL